MRRQAGRFFTLFGLLFIAVATLAPLPGQVTVSAATPLWCLACGHHGGVDVFVNLLLFIPLAFGLRLWGIPAARVVAAGGLISLAVESLQLSVITGRDASLSDLVTNTLGSGAGAALASRIRFILWPHGRAAAALAAGGAAAWLAIQGATALLLQPWAPSGPLRAEWTQSSPGRPGFGGRLTFASLSGVPRPDGTLSSLRLPNHSGRGPIELELQMLSGPPTPRPTPIFELLGSHGALLSVDAAGTSIAFHPPARTYLLRLRGPAIRLPDALPESSGRRVRIAAGEDGLNLWISAAGGAERGTRRLALSPSFGWSIVLPFEYAYGPEVHFLTALWVAGLLFPVGYWGAGSGSGVSLKLSAAAGLLAAGLYLVARFGGFPMAHWSEWAAGVAGLTGGGAGRAAAAYFSRRCDSPSISESC
ncbi:MAG: VanZ family protein [Gemmatimonadales bacterium]|nr:VanZ family protein [Gemmatimonadales bacterium]